MSAGAANFINYLPITEGWNYVFLVIEDAHWIDPTTLELIELCLGNIASKSVFVLITTRPENQPLLPGHTNVSNLSLNRLAKRNVEAIVTQLAGSALTSQSIAEIISRTDGVPLFAEEVTRATLESDDARIPVALHDSLMALCDPLAPAEFGNRILATQAFQHDPDLLLHAVAFARLSADLADVLFGRRLRPGFRSYLRSFRATMISKSSTSDSSQTVSGMLTGNTSKGA